MSLQPIIEFRDPVTPANLLATVTFLGGGFNNAIPAGGTSSPVTVRIYNNFAVAASIGDALSCVLAVYDDTTHQGAAAIQATSQAWVQVKVTNYDGITTGADGAFTAIGGSTKHSVPTNSGTIAGAAAHYITVVIQIVVPTNASTSVVSGQGLWLEYSWV